MKDKRLYFLDAVRAFAILMMLQGHFIDGLLDPIYKSNDYIIFSIWSDLRGNTAPLFFTITGLVVMFLLKKAEAKNNENFRIKKSIKRGISLILIGYALRIPVFYWLSGHFNSYFLVIDVLQIIGVSLLILNGLYFLLKSKPLVLSLLLTTIGTLIFLSEPLYRNLALPHIPDVVVNYITKENGSVFTFFPWFGYVAYGSVLGIIFQKFQNKEQFKSIAISSFLIGGFALSFLSSMTLEALYYITDIKLFYNASIYNYLFSRLGSVAITFGIFYALESYLKHPLISKLGNNTLSIYVVHFIILYGSFTGVGLYRYFHHSLEPIIASIGALAFVVAVTFIVLQEDKIKAFLNVNIRKALLFIKLNTVSRIRLNRR
ncbi:heparan-alpha-glucosaminide N-acetyltransferase domain-containing protein [uncultured Formosa sp.]|uniref:heparan-alpha-glucosaminide N-acetyltransferase domain-containing protein n=1 Tax=uncultured Formosa sp. TaxID=255435 RepID=UPI002624BCEC|nr:heparan-alpha-glucosaminide N-acetyltransferase domain-containing protein [uncultured Formosa sp.]